MSQTSDSTDIGWNIPKNRRSRSKSPRLDQLTFDFKNQLKDKIFVGHFQEKRLVRCLNSYRDLVVINNNETSLITELSNFNRTLRLSYTDNTWIGITEPSMIGTPASYCIWSDVGDLPFGQYWFQIKRLQSKENEIFIKLKIIRPFEYTNERTNTNRRSTHSQDGDKVESENNNSVPLIQMMTTESLIEFLNRCKQSIGTFSSANLTKENLIIFTKFIGLLMVSLFVGTIHGIKFIGIYSLEFMKHFNVLVKNMTPIIVKLIDFITKTVGGIFILISMVWRDYISSRNNNYRRPPQYQAITYNRNRRYN